MSIERESRRKNTGTRTNTALSDETRRRIVRILREDSGAVSVQELAEQLVATEPAELATDDADRLGVRLHHVHLPKLADHGLVDWDKREQTVAATDHGAYETEQLGGSTMGNSGERTTPSLIGDRLHEALAVIESENESISRETLARKLARRESDSQPRKSLVENIDVQLHHRYLPELAEAGSVEYDSDNGTVEHRDSARSTAPLPGRISDL